MINSTSDSSIDGSTFPPELLSNSMMTFMVKGLFSDLEFPYVYFPSRNITGYLLFEPFWEAINRLERSGFHVNIIYNIFMYGTVTTTKFI